MPELYEMANLLKALTLRKETWHGRVRKKQWQEQEEGWRQREEMGLQGGRGVCVKVVDMLAFLRMEKISWVGGCQNSPNYTF